MFPSDYRNVFILTRPCIYIICVCVRYATAVLAIYDATL